jgi:hypothetical protein
VWATRSGPAAQAAAATLALPGPVSGTGGVDRRSPARHAGYACDVGDAEAVRTVFKVEKESSW